MVGVLMGDHDRGQAGDALETVGEGTGSKSKLVCPNCASKQEWPKCVKSMVLSFCPALGGDGYRAGRLAWITS